MMDVPALASVGLQLLASSSPTRKQGMSGGRDTSPTRQQEISPFPLLARGTCVPKRPALPIRVCFLIDQLSKAGTESQLLALLQHLDRGQVQPFLCLLNGENAASRALEPDDCPVLRLSVRSLHQPATLGKALAFVKFLKRERIDVVQVYFPDSTHFGVPLARLAGVRRVVRTRFNLGYNLTRLDRWLGRVYSRLVDATVTNCEACRQSVIHDEGALPGSVHIIENGVELERFLAIPLPEFAPNRPRRVGLVANLRPVKEPDVFVRAARLLVDTHPHSEFHLAGEGELRSDLERLIAALDLQGRVILHGRVQDIPRFLGQVDVAVLCSRSEGSSNALLEYMAAGRAVVATAVGGTLQLLDDGVQGLLVPPGDPGRLAATLRRLFDEPALARHLAAAARQRVRERHDVRVRARRYEALFRQLLGRSC